MPRIPLLDERSVLPGVAPIPSRQPLDQPARARAVLGDVVAQGANELGQTLVRIGIERDDSAAREASVEANEELRVRYQTEILTRKMGDATGAAEATSTLFDDVGRKHEEQLSPRQRQLFSQHYRTNRPTYLDQATRHEIDQKALHQDFTRKRQAGSHIDNAELDVLNESARERELTLGLQAIYTHQPMGTPREMVEAEAEAYRSLFHVRMATKLADDEPLQADAYLKQYAAEIPNDNVTQELRARIDRRTVNVRAQQEADALMAENSSSDDALKAARAIDDSAIRDETEQRLRIYQQDEQRRESEALDTRIDQNERRWRTFSRDQSGKLVLPPRAAIEWINTLPDVAERNKYFAEYDQLQVASTKTETAVQKAAATADAKAERATQAKREQDAVWGRWNRLSKTEKLQEYKRDGLAQFGLVGDNHSKALTDVDGIRRGAKPNSREWATKVLVEAGQTDDERIGRIIGVWEEEIASLPGPEVGLPEQRALLLNLTRDDLEVAGVPGVGFSLYFGAGDDISDITEIAGDADQLSRVVIPRNEFSAVVSAIEADNAKRAAAGKPTVEPTAAHVRRIWMRQFFPSRDAELRALMGR